MGALYAKDSKIYCNDYMEIYIPKDYFDPDTHAAENKGTTISVLGILYCKVADGKIQSFDIPTIVDLNIYASRDDVIEVHNKKIDVLVLEYLKDSYIVHQTLPKGREVANKYLNTLLGGKLPQALRYSDAMNQWWKNLEMAGISYKVPSQMFEMIIAANYRDPHNPKKRYGQVYGKQEVPDEFGYKPQNVRETVKNLSTFSGMVFEDISTMITNGLNNSKDNVEEPISPLEKIIHY